MLFGVTLMSSANEFREYADEYGDRRIKKNDHRFVLRLNPGGNR